MIPPFVDDLQMSGRKALEIVHTESSVAFAEFWSRASSGHVTSGYDHRLPREVAVHSLQELYALYRPAITIVDRYVTVVWYVVGFPGNLLALIVWIQPEMRHSSGCYLAALAAADFLFLLLQLCFELQSAWNVNTLKVPVLCEVFPVLFLATQYIGPLLVLGFTVERYISVCHPFQRERFCSTRRALTVIAALSVTCLSLHLVQAYFWRYDPLIGDCSVRSEVTINDAQSIWTIWSWVTELLVFGAVPLTILGLNVLVIAETRRFSAKETRMVRLQATTRCSRSHSASSATTAMLLAVSFYLIATTLPATVCYAIYFSFPTGNLTLTETEAMTYDVTWQRHFSYWMARTIVQEVCMSHYAGNFYIYLLTGALFRVELRRIFRRLRFDWCCRKRIAEASGVCAKRGSGRGGRGGGGLGVVSTTDNRWRDESHVFSQMDYVESVSYVGMTSLPM